MVNFKVDDNLVSNKYEKVENKTSNDSKLKTQNMSKPIPVGKSEDNKSEKMTGLVVEHQDENNDKTKNNDVDEKQKEEMFSRKTFDNRESPLNTTYRNLVRKNVGLHNIPGSSLTNNNLTEAFEDIDNIEKRRIRTLASDMPESGLLSGNVVQTYEATQTDITHTTYLNINNSWQNKKKNFGIVADVTLNYEHSRIKADSVDDIADDISDDISDDDAAQVTEALKNEDDDEKGYIQNETDKKSFSGRFSINARYDTENMTFGAGVSETFYNDSDKVLDINVTGIHKPTHIGFDLMRRKVMVQDQVTGESVIKTKMKLKVDLLDRKGDNEDDYPDDDKIKPHDITLPSESHEEIQHAKEEDNKIKNVKTKNGSGIDVDFEYDDTKCGFIAEYGIHLINNPKTRTRLTVSPVFGLYRYSGAEESDEAAKITFGGCVEFKKKWANGQTLSADLTALNNRIAAQGAHPVDAFHSIFTSSYNNPKAKLNANVDAGYIKSEDNSIGFVEGRVGYQIKDFNIGVKGGYSISKGEDVFDDHCTQLAASVMYKIPYKTKK